MEEEEKLSHLPPRPRAPFIPYRDKSCHEKFHDLTFVIVLMQLVIILISFIGGLFKLWLTSDDGIHTFNTDPVADEFAKIVFIDDDSQSNNRIIEWESSGSDDDVNVETWDPTVTNYLFYHFLVWSINLLINLIGVLAILTDAFFILILFIGLSVGELLINYLGNLPLFVNSVGMIIKIIYEISNGLVLIIIIFYTISLCTDWWKKNHLRKRSEKIEE